nr:NADH dehydrogenase subunit 6 [Uniformus sp.]
MKSIILKLMIMCSSSIFMFKNPMAMGLMLMFQTFLTIMLINLVSFTSWFSLITFLMMIGGLLILIMYMSSIAANEKFKMNINLMFILTILVIMFEDMLIETQILENQEPLNNLSLKFSMVKMFSKKSITTIMLVIYLLLTMISASKIVKVHMGPLRSFNNYE